MLDVLGINSGPFPRITIKNITVSLENEVAANRGNSNTLHFDIDCVLETSPGFISPEWFEAGDLARYLKFHFVAIRQSESINTEFYNRTYHPQDRFLSLQEMASAGPRNLDHDSGDIVSMTDLMEKMVMKHEGLNDGSAAEFSHSLVSLHDIIRDTERDISFYDDLRNNVTRTNLTDLTTSGGIAEIRFTKRLSSIVNPSYRNQEDTRIDDLQIYAFSHFDVDEFTGDRGESGYENLLAFGGNRAILSQMNRIGGNLTREVVLADGSVPSKKNVLALRSDPSVIYRGPAETTQTGLQTIPPVGEEPRELVQIEVPYSKVHAPIFIEEAGEDRWGTGNYMGTSLYYDAEIVGYNLVVPSTSLQDYQREIRRIRTLINPINSMFAEQDHYLDNFLGQYTREFEENISGRNRNTIDYLVNYDTWNHLDPDSGLSTRFLITLDTRRILQHNSEYSFFIKRANPTLFETNFLQEALRRARYHRVDLFRRRLSNSPYGNNPTCVPDYEVYEKDATDEYVVTYVQAPDVAPPSNNTIEEINLDIQIEEESETGTLDSGFRESDFKSFLVSDVEITRKRTNSKYTYKLDMVLEDGIRLALDNKRNLLRQRLTEFKSTFLSKVREKYRYANYYNTPEDPLSNDLYRGIYFTDEGAPPRLNYIEPIAGPINPLEFDNPAATAHWFVYDSTSGLGKYSNETQGAARAAGRANDFFRSLISLYVNMLYFLGPDSMRRRARRANQRRIRRMVREIQRSIWPGADNATAESAFYFYDQASLVLRTLDKILDKGDFLTPAFIGEEVYSIYMDKVDSNIHTGRSYNQPSPGLTTVAKIPTRDGNKNNLIFKKIDLKVSVLPAPATNILLAPQNPIGNREIRAEVPVGGISVPADVLTSPGLSGINVSLTGGYDLPDRISDLPAGSRYGDMAPGQFNSSNGPQRANVQIQSEVSDYFQSYEPYGYYTIKDGRLIDIMSKESIRKYSQTQVRSLELHLNRYLNTDTKEVNYGEEYSFETSAKEHFNHLASYVSGLSITVSDSRLLKRFLTSPSPEPSADTASENTSLERSEQSSYSNMPDKLHKAICESVILKGKTEAYLEMEKILQKQEWALVDAAEAFYKNLSNIYGMLETAELKEDMAFRSRRKNAGPMQRYFKEKNSYLMIKDKFAKEHTGEVGYSLVTNRRISSFNTRAKTNNGKVMVLRFSKPSLTFNEEKKISIVNDVVLVRV